MRAASTRPWSGVSPRSGRPAGRCRRSGRPLAPAHPAGRARRGRGGGDDDRAAGDRHRGVPGLCRAGAAAGAPGPPPSDRRARPARLPPQPCVLAAFAVAGVEVRFLPAYSPDFNPIEPCWSKIKTALRNIAARCLEALDEVMPAVLNTISARDARRWFCHCGYAAT